VRSRLAGPVERSSERVVESAQTDLVGATISLPARTSRAPERRSSASTIGRAIRSIAA
jgi:hypothetical protein